jgi:peptide/nickel transport system permease protein
MASYVAVTGRWGARRRRQSRKLSWLGRIVFPLVSLIVLLAIVGPWIAPSNINSSNILGALKAPSASHWLGTDNQGRDVLWRVIVGARASLFSSVAIVTGFSCIGVLVASLATVGPRWLDEVLMRFVDAALAIPPIIFALGVAAALGPSLKSAIIAMTLTGWPYTARLLRGIMRQTTAMPFVEGASTLGVSRTRLMRKHILPNSLDILVVKWFGDVGNTILVLGALSFVGVAAQPPSAEWGASITAARGDLSLAWWPAFAPGVAIAVTALALSLMGDVLQTRRNPELGDR